MQSSAPSVNVPVGTQPPKFAAHFATLDVQNHAARLGMWLFLSTEILLFAGLFACYAFYRFTFPEAFAQGSRHLDIYMGTVNTIVLITSSFTAAMAVHYAKTSNNKMVSLMITLTLVMALAFLVIKGFEYHHKFEQGTLPGKYYTSHEMQVPGITLFFTVYFLSTGLHAFHVIIGMIVLAWVMSRSMKNHFNHANYTAVELGSMYWHLVDLVWIFLFPMLYLI